jgi:hypothetical protein
MIDFSSHGEDFKFPVKISPKNHLGDFMRPFTLTFTLSLILSFSAFGAEKSRRSQQGAQAAATMTAGYSVMKGFIKASDIEKRFSQLIYETFSGHPNQMIYSSIESGDKITIKYSNSDHLYQEFEQKNLLNKEYKSLLDERKLIERRIRFAQTNGDLKLAAQLTKEQEQIVGAMEKNVRKSNGVLRRIKMSQVSPKTIVLSNASEQEVAYKIRSLVDGRKSVYAVKRVPGSVVKKMARARNGYILAGTAVALGLLTAEEVISGKIAVKREEELKKFN